MVGFMAGSDHNYDEPMTKPIPKPKVVTDEVKCFIAIARGPVNNAGSNNSGFKASEEDAIKWAIDFLAKNGNVTYVNIAHIFGRVERKTAPVEFKLLPNSLED